MSDVAADNLGVVECWNEILTPKWIRVRHLLCGNGKIHSERARMLARARRAEPGTRAPAGGVTPTPIVIVASLGVK